METITTPPGVTEVTPPVTPPVNPVQTTPPIVADKGTVVDDQPSSVAKWNWLEIGAGVALLTVAFFAIHYFRHRTKQERVDSEEKERKIITLQGDISKIKQQMAA